MECGRKPQAPDVPERASRRIKRSTAAANIFQPRIHQRVFRADCIHEFGGIDFPSWSSFRRRLCGCGRRSGRSLVVAGEPSARVRYRFAFRRLGNRGLGQRANRDEHGKKSHFNPFLGQRIQAMKCWRFEAKRDYSVKSKSLPDFTAQNARIRAPCPLVISNARQAAGR